MATFNPRQFVPRFQDVREAGQLLGAAAAQIPGLVEARRQGVKNEQILSQLQANLPAIRDEAFTNAGTTRDEVAAMLNNVETKGKDLMTFTSELQQVMAPIRIANLKLTELQRGAGIERAVGERLGAGGVGAGDVTQVAIPGRGRFTEETIAERLPAATTQREALGRLGGLQVGGRPVTLEEAQETFAFTGLPTREGQLKELELGAQLGKLGAQTEAAKALAGQRKASQLLTEFKTDPSKVRAAEVKDLRKAELAARVALSKTPKFETDEFGQETGVPSDEFINLQALAEDIKKARVEKEKGQISPTDISASPQAIRISAEIESAIPEEFTGEEFALGGTPQNARRLRLANSVVEKGRQLGLSVDAEKVAARLSEGITLEQIIQEMLNAVKGQ